MFTINCRHVSLTYPRCSIPPVAALAQLVGLIPVDRFPDRQILVVQEDHNEVDVQGASGLHLHAYIDVGPGKKLHKTDAVRFFDLVMDDAPPSHPHVEGCRNYQDWIKYCLKDVAGKPERVCGIPADWWLSLQGTKKRKWEACAGMVATGSTFGDIQKWDPGFALQHMRAVREAITYRDEIQVQVEMETVNAFLNWEPAATHFVGLTPSVLAIWRTLKSSLRPGESASRQLWLYGPTGVGKSFFLNSLRSVLNVYEIPRTDYLELFQDGRFQLSFMDEFKGSKPLTWMNQWVDPYPMFVSKKGTGNSFLRKISIATLILSNYSLRSPENYRELYGMPVIETLARRFAEFEVDQSIMRELTRLVQLFKVSRQQSLEIRMGNGLINVPVVNGQQTLPAEHAEAALQLMALGETLDESPVSSPLLN